MHDASIYYHRHLEHLDRHQHPLIVPFQQNRHHLLQYAMQFFHHFYPVHLDPHRFSTNLLRVRHWNNHTIQQHEVQYQHVLWVVPQAIAVPMIVWFAFVLLVLVAFVGRLGFLGCLGRGGFVDFVGFVPFDLLLSFFFLFFLLSLSLSSL